jgi:hypothetical protein
VAGHLIYHWKHGWIPLTHAAALSKAHGNSHLADKYVAGASAHHESRPTAGKSAREIHGGLEQHAHITARPGTYRGESGHHIAGKDTRGRRVAVFVPGDRAAAQRAIDNLHAGRPAFDASHTAPTSGAPANAAAAFRMKGPELREHAGNGSTVAQAELDRRAGKPGKAEKPATAPAPSPQAKSLTSEELQAQNRGDLKVGDKVAVKVAGGVHIGTVQGFDASGRAQLHVDGHGMVQRTAADVSKNIHPATKAAAERRLTGDWSKTPAATLQRALTSDAFQPGQKDAMRAELQRRGIAVNAPATPPAAPKTTTYADKTAEAAARWDAENARIAPPGHTITSKALGTTNAGTPQGFHSQSAANGDRVGSVIEQRDGGGYRAVFDGKPIGVFPSRGEAHQALADKHAAVAAAAKAKADAVARRQAKAVPIGLFRPQAPVTDGTARGNAAAAKIKQSFKLNNHNVHIETAMSKDQTKALLDDIHSVLLKTGHLDSEGITFHVPSGDAKFRQTRRGTVGGYVRRGQRTIFVNPKIANGSIADSFGGSGASGSFMPAARQTNGRQYVITHELGHVLDNEHMHTHERSYLGSRRVAFDANRDDVAALQRQHRDNLSQYGKTNVAESYAEAYAQWIHGGPGSSAAADAYAAKFGWKVPKWYREGRKP